MNFICEIIPIVFFKLIILVAYSQNSHESMSYLEFKNNLNRTKHLNSPISINTYFEGGEMLNQDAKFTNSYEFYLNLRKQNEIEYRVGIGLTKIRFKQTREDWTGIAPDFFEIVEEEIQYKFVNLLLGCRKYFSKESRLKPLVGLVIIFDKNLRNEYQVNYGISIEGEIGIEYMFSDNLAISSNLLYRNALLPYNKNKNYYPNLLGIGISLKCKLNTHHNKP